MKKLLFFCRYSLPGDDHSFTFPSSIAAERKIDGICNSLYGAGILPILFLTPSSPCVGLWQPARVLRSDNRVFVIPCSTNIFGNRILSYIANTFIAAIFSVRFVSGKNIFASMIYNMMPDTAIPAMVLRFFYNDRPQIFDFEEEISADHEAPKIFRWFDSFSRKKFFFDAALLSASRLKTSVLASEYALFHGFTTASEIDVAYRVSEMNLSLDSLGESRIRISFIGRLDSMRCITEFLDAVKNLAKQQLHVSISVVGYCNDGALLAHIKSEVEIIQKLVPITLSVSVPREEVVQALAESDICVSLVKDATFLERSFPSKLVEYLLFNCVVVSQYVYDLRDVDNFVWIPTASRDDVLTGLTQALHKVRDCQQPLFNGREWVQANCTTASGSQRFTKLFADIAESKIDV